MEYLEVSAESRSTKNGPLRRLSKSELDAANLLSFTDQALFLSLRSMDQESIIQATWIYEHPVDFDGLKRFHENFGYGLAGRLIERSPLPFGRHRWVASPGAPMDIEIDEPRPRSELGEWVDERAQLPMDAELGPGWRIGVLPMTDGSTAITMTGSHALGDGIAAAMRAFEAVNGIRSDLGYPPPGTRTRGQAITEDFRQALHDLPEAWKALKTFAGLANRYRKEIGTKARKRSKSSAIALTPAERKQNVMLPAVFVTLDIPEWDACAERLGGNGHSLLAGFAAEMSRKLGRVNQEDGTVTILIPISDRQSLEDGRANAVAVATTKFDPSNITHDLSEARSAMRDSVQKAREVPDEMLGVLPLIPWVPKRSLGGIANAAFGFSADVPAFCSNVGDLPAEILRIDGTEAEYLFFRGIDRRVTREALERRHGLLTVMAGRVGGRVLMSIVAYQPGWDNTKPKLGQLVVEALDAFGLSGRIE